jgi:hypothetical protein
MDGLSLDNIGLPLSKQEKANVLTAVILTGAAKKPTRPILAFIGDPGAAKTSNARALMQWLEGPEADVISMPKTADDLLVVANDRNFLALDNVDTRFPWVNDTLASIATGTGREGRKLYTDSERAKTPPIRCSLILTSVAPPFDRADVADRTIVLPMRRLEAFVPEEDMQRRTNALRQAFQDALDNDLVTLRKKGPVVRASRMRMADFERALRGVAGDGADHILDVLLQSQAMMALRDDPVVEALVGLTSDGRVPRGSAGQLHKRIEGHLRGGLPYDLRTAKALGGHLRMIRAPAKVLGLEINWRMDNHLKTYIYSVRRCG